MPVPLTNAQGQVEQIEPEDVGDALRSGKYGAPSDQQFHVTDAQGQVQTVPITGILQHLNAGGQVLSPEEAQARLHTEKYGGIKGETYSALEGANTMGLFGAAHALMSPEEKANTREYVEENPTANIAGQVAGAVLPIAADIATGGAATPEIVAGEAAARGAAEVGIEGAATAAKALPELVAPAAKALAPEAGLLSQAATASAKAVAAPMRAVGAAGGVAGDLTEAALRKVVGSEATSVAGKLAEKGLIGAAKAGTEGALIGTAQTAGDELLNEHPDLTAEKLAHGGLLGGLMGIAGAGVLGLGGSLASRFSGDVSKSLDKASTEQAVRSTMATSDRRGIRDVLRLTGEEEGTEASMKTAGDYLLKKQPALGGESIVGFGDNVETMLPKAEKVTQSIGQEIGGVLKEADAAAVQGPKLQTINEQLDKSLASLTKGAKSLKEGTLNKIEKLRADLAEAAGLAPEGAEAAASVTPKKPTFTEAQEFLKTPEGKQALTAALQGKTDNTVLETLGKGQVPKDIEDAMMAKAPGTFPGAPPVPVEDARLSFEAASNFRRDIDEAINWETDPTGKISPAAKSLKAIRGAIEDEVETALKKGSPELHERYTDAKGQYGVAKTMEKILTRSVATKTANQQLGLVSKGAGLVGLSSLAHGNPIGAALSIGAPMAHQLIQNRGQSAAAHILDKLASTQALTRIGEQSDRALRRVVQAAVHGTSHPEHASKVKIPGTYEGQVASVVKAASNPEELMDNLSNATAGISDNHPAVAASVAKHSVNALTYLAQNVPPQEHPNLDSLTPQLDKPQVPITAQDSFTNKYKAVLDPIASLEKIKSGTLTKDEVDAIKATHPQTYATTAAAIRAELANVKKPLDYKAEQSMRLYLGLPQVPPRLSAVLTSNEAVGLGGSKGGAPSPRKEPSGSSTPLRGAPKRKVGDKVATDLKLP